MMKSNPRTLEQMAHRLTAYEVIARHENGQEMHLAFTARHTKLVLLAIAQSNGNEILEMLGSWDGEVTYAKTTGWTFGPVSVRFSGRTERGVSSLLEEKA